MIWAPSIQVSGSASLSESLSIDGRDGLWVTLRSKWLETEGDELDYWQLLAEVADGTSIDSEAASSIALPSASPIVSIDVLVATHVDDNVRIEHDAALIFNHADGTVFYIGPDASMSEMVEFVADVDEVEKVRSSLKHRLTISDEPSLRVVR